ncbi:MAG TPA: TraR/DksA family transcriptional regulator [Planctomycetota bacterium]|nr:TraR/DksA family transcriptional regulator [Planctomycetota bacterium]
MTQPSKDRPALTPEDLASLREALIERRTAKRQSISRLSGDAGDRPRGAGELSTTPLHLADLGTETFEQDRDLGLAERESQELSQIDEALDRIEDGSYGQCESCERPINRDRLEALPFARRCLPCQSKAEAEGEE